MTLWSEQKNIKSIYNLHDFDAQLNQNPQNI